MKIQLIALLVVLCAPFPALAAAVPVDSQISAVTVYTDRAVVSRIAQLPLVAGESEWIFDKLPSGLLEESLQVSGKGTADATILDVGVRTTHVPALVDARLKQLVDELIAMERRKELLQDRRDILEHQGDLLEKIEDAIAAPPAKEGTARLTVEESQKLLALGHSTTAQLAEEKRKLAWEREELDEQIDASRAQLQALREKSGNGRSYKTVTVRVAAEKAGNMTIALSYGIEGASWVPSYDARLRGEERVVALSYFGTIRQNTGEDWKDVALTLSTAKPALGGATPELKSWVLDVFRPSPVQTGATKEADEMLVLNSFSVASNRKREYSNLLAAAAAPDQSEESDAEFATASLDSAVSSASFKVAAPATILSDNSPQKVAITTIRLAANLQYQATPRLLEAAFLTAYMTNTTEFPLLAGNVNTFLGDSFVATGSLETVMPSEKLELPLGADESIGVKRKVVNRFSENTGLAGKGRRVTYEFLVTLTNNKKTTERVMFTEGLPVSRNEKIVVKLITPAERDVGAIASPKEVTREADGKLVWRVDLKPGEKREFPLKFSVEHPADVTVTGLE